MRWYGTVRRNTTWSNNMTPSEQSTTCGKLQQSGVTPHAPDTRTNKARQSSVHGDRNSALRTRVQNGNVTWLVVRAHDRITWCQLQPLWQVHGSTPLARVWQAVLRGQQMPKERTIQDGDMRTTIIEKVFQMVGACLPRIHIFSPANGCQPRVCIGGLYAHMIYMFFSSKLMHILVSVNLREYKCATLKCPSGTTEQWHQPVAGIRPQRIAQPYPNRRTCHAHQEQSA